MGRSLRATILTASVVLDALQIFVMFETMETIVSSVHVIKRRSSLSTFHDTGPSAIYVFLKETVIQYEA